MGEQKSPKNSHLMIFMRSLLTDGVGVCQVKAYHTELATTCPCMALVEIHNSETHWTLTLDTANEIHDPVMIFMVYLTRVATHKGLDKCLGLDSILACLLLLNFRPHIQAPLPTISPLNTKVISLMVLCKLVQPSFTCISTSARS